MTLRRKLNKERIDDAIRACKAFYGSSGFCLCDEYMRAVKAATDVADTHWVMDLITAVTLKNQEEPFETYYKVLEAAGLQIEGRP